MALYIAIEGGEGAGKSTQAKILTKKLGAIRTFEPGNTDLGGRLRQLLLGVGEAPVGPRAETLMMAADRAQHMDEVVRPALERGQHVISDRTAYSSLAYQGGGRGLGIDAVRSLNDWALDGLWPDLVILLDCDPAASHRRGAADRLESEAASFHESVRRTFLELAASESDRWTVIDASQSIAEVSTLVMKAVEDKLRAAAEVEQGSS